jgi:hypothetical protein
MHIKNMIAGLAVLGALAVAPLGISQDRDRDRDRDSGERVTRIEPGTNIKVRTNDSIDAEKFDNRVYYGVVDQDVRGENGRLAVPRGSRVELIVRVMRDNDLVLDLESVNVNGQRYAIQTDKNHVEAQRDNSLVGSILGAINGGQAQGRAVHIPRGAVLNFRIQTPLTMGAADRGVDRNGNHYHDYYRPNDHYAPNDVPERGR